jgi:hypothetical protein
MRGTDGTLTQVMNTHLLVKIFLIIICLLLLQRIVGKELNKKIKGYASLAYPFILDISGLPEFNIFNNI